jgi:hypothetical protein
LVSSFVDRDMVMRYDGNGIGHRSTRAATQSASTAVEDPEEPNEDADSPPNDAQGAIDENDLYDWGYANEDDDGDGLRVEEDAPGTAGEAGDEPIDEYDEEGYAPL